MKNQNRLLTLPDGSVCGVRLYSRSQNTIFRHNMVEDLAKKEVRRIIDAEVKRLEELSKQLKIRASWISKHNTQRN